jgi:hypothetical protein
LRPFALGWRNLAFVIGTVLLIPLSIEEKIVLMGTRITSIADSIGKTTPFSQTQATEKGMVRPAATGSFHQKECFDFPWDCARLGMSVVPRPV